MGSARPRCDGCALTIASPPCGTLDSFAMESRAAKEDDDLSDVDSDVASGSAQLIIIFILGAQER